MTQESPKANKNLVSPSSTGQLRRAISRKKLFSINENPYFDKERERAPQVKAAREKKRVEEIERRKYRNHSPIKNHKDQYLTEYERCWGVDNARANF